MIWFGLKVPRDSGRGADVSAQTGPRRRVICEGWGSRMTAMIEDKAVWLSPLNDQSDLIVDDTWTIYRDPSSWVAQVLKLTDGQRTPW